MLQASSIHYKLRKQWFWLVVGLVAIAAVQVIDVRSARSRAIAIEQAYLQNIAGVSADIVSTQLLAADQLVESIRAEIRTSFNDKSVPAAYSSALARQVRVVPGTDIILVQDADGKVTASNREELVGQNFSHREYFQNARSEPASVGSVSNAFVTVLGVRTFAFSKSLVDSRGRFAGAIMVTDRKSVV